MRKIQIKLHLIILLMFISILKINAYEFANPDNRSSINSQINEIFNMRDLYVDLFGYSNEDETLIKSISSNLFWWPIGSTEITTVNGKDFAIGTPQYTHISSVFGAKEKGIHDNSPDGHGAIDIPGDLGKTYVIASQNGVVTAVVDGYKDDNYVLHSYNLNKANYVIIQHDNGIVTKYWHLAKNSITVSVGERVEKGQVIGKVGSSGYSTGPHLHFQVEDANGTKINPINYVNPDNPRPVSEGSNRDRLIKLLNYLETGNLAIGKPDSEGYYKVIAIGDGVRTVGHGVTLENNPDRFKKYGININDYPTGSRIKADIVDQIESDIVDYWEQSIKKSSETNSVTLNENELYALIIRSYQMGNFNGFFSNYKKYGNSNDLLNNWWMTTSRSFSEGIRNRRNNEWKLFHDGIYVNEQ